MGTGAMTQLVPWQGVNTDPKRFAAMLVAS
jgi:hypothetical protein